MECEARPRLLQWDGWRQSRHINSLPSSLVLGKTKAIWSCLPLVAPQAWVIRSRTAQKFILMRAPRIPPQGNHRKGDEMLISSPRLNNDCSLTLSGRRKRQVLHCAGPSRPAAQRLRPPTDKGLAAVGAFIPEAHCLPKPCLARRPNGVWCWFWFTYYSFIAFASAVLSSALPCCVKVRE
ncbi:hypothetical protein K469DRAFT_387844 [Zopfia rhizophila CBS 207.26]|uniref:Uncharacterized protein n=1 Tax=Zopfia rhizophila CBS 207.26 TaxID=1314779 RepID=A0A6A6EGA1_9PEZI|nr:hypothetical protein K469DRAFT_387844 [Zopfia rhizophila CBS 207.26]